MGETYRNIFKDIAIYLSHKIRIWEMMDKYADCGVRNLEGTMHYKHKTTSIKTSSSYPIVIHHQGGKQKYRTRALGEEKIMWGKNEDRSTKQFLGEVNSGMRWHWRITLMRIATSIGKMWTRDRSVQRRNRNRNHDHDSRRNIDDASGYEEGEDCRHPMDQ